MVASLSLLFFDGPTSGLDSATAYNVMGELKRIAKTTGTAVPLNIHRQSQKIFEMADTILLISGGHTCYSCPAHVVVKYFRSLVFIQTEGASENEWTLDFVSSVETMNMSISALYSTLAWIRTFVCSDTI